MTLGDTLISKEALIGFTLWLIAAVGVGSANGGITKRTEIERPVSAISGVTQIVRLDEINAQKAEAERRRAKAILTTQFLFNERSENVAALQQHLGVLVDQHYGKFTRQAHLDALSDAGLDTSIVPAIPNPLKDGGSGRYTISTDPTHRCPQFEPMFEQYGLLPVEVFSYIAYRESRCNPNAVNARFDSSGKVIWTMNKNGSVDRGLLQINSSWRTVTQNICGTGVEGQFDLGCNLKIAKYLLDNGGLKHWNVWKK